MHQDLIAMFGMQRVRTAYNPVPLKTSHPDELLSPSNFRAPHLRYYPHVVLTTLLFHKLLRYNVPHISYQASLTLCLRFSSYSSILNMTLRRMNRSGTPYYHTLIRNLPEVDVRDSLVGLGLLVE